MSVTEENVALRRAVGTLFLTVVVWGFAVSTAAGQNYGGQRIYGPEPPWAPARPVLRVPGRDPASGDALRNADLALGALPRDYWRRRFETEEHEVPSSIIR